MDKWMVVPDCIAFNIDGFMMNGQHRLHAIIKSGIPQMICVMRGLHPDAMIVTDTGKARTYKDAFELMEIPNPGECAAIIGRYKALCMGKNIIDGMRNYDRVGVSRDKMVTRWEYIKFYNQHSNTIQRIAEWAIKMGKIDKYIPKKSEMMGIVLFLHLVKGFEIRIPMLFFSQLAKSDYDIKSVSPIKRVKGILQYNNEKGISLSSKVKQNLIIKCFNSWYTKKNELIVADVMENCQFVNAISRDKDQKLKKEIEQENQKKEVQTEIEFVDEPGYSDELNDVLKNHAIIRRDGYGNWIQSIESDLLVSDQGYVFSIPHNEVISGYIDACGTPIRISQC